MVVGLELGCFTGIRAGFKSDPVERRLLRLRARSAPCSKPTARARLYFATPRGRKRKPHTLLPAYRPFDFEYPKSVR